MQKGKQPGLYRRFCPALIDEWVELCYDMVYFVEQGRYKMLFNSFHFLVFFPIVLLVYFVIPRKSRYIWLLLSSYYFYMGWNPKYALLLLFSTVITYGSSLLLVRFREKPGKKKLVVAACVIVNITILFFFKYFAFAMNALEKVLGLLHITLPEVTLNLLLPVGISFYIFQAVGYMIDVYREEIEPERNLFRYALFVSFFPQLVAGPIERSKSFLPQIQKLPDIKLWDFHRIRSGALIMLYGYILKMIIADRAAIFVDTVYNTEAYNEYKGFMVLVAAVLFSIQIYCDFAGYTFIAIGAAKIMGIQLMNNFNAPYFAVSIKDFWDRWHISLTSWFRDYLYFPLGGSRRGKVRKYINILIIFTVSGLWHGASFHYVAWGMLHGVLRVGGELTKKLRSKACVLLKVRRGVLSYKLFQICLTFLEVTIAWMFFRAESVRQAVDMLKNMFAQPNIWVLFDGSLFTLGLDAKDFNVLLIFIGIMLLADYLRSKKVSLTAHFAKQSIWFQWLVFFVGIWSVLVFGVYGPGFDATQFIYFQF